MVTNFHNLRVSLLVKIMTDASIRSPYEGNNFAIFEMANLCMSKELEDLLRIIEEDEIALEKESLLNAIEPSVNMSFL